MSDEPIPHPRTQYFMGWAETLKQRDARLKRELDALEANDEDWEEDDPLFHIWPLMGWLEADARFKLHQTDEVELYALCGIRLYDYVKRLDGGAPVPYGDHWEERGLCPKCLAKYQSR